MTRCLLNCTENCLYVCLQFPTGPNLRWFTLCPKPDKTLNSHISKKKTTESSSGNVLAQVQILNSPPVEWSNLVAVGHKLYAINKEDDAPCYSLFLDCRTDKWVETPSLRFTHTIPGIDGMMYLAGSYENPDSLNCLEVFNTKTQTWMAVPLDKKIFREGDFQGKAYKNLVTRSGTRVSFVVKLKDSIFDWVGSDNACEIEQIFYRYVRNREFLWSKCGPQLFIWRKVKGLEELPKFGHYKNVKLVDCVGKMLVFCDKYLPSRGSCKEKMIWCAEISLETRSSEEVWGKVEWFDALLTVPESYKFVYARAATV